MQIFVKKDGFKCYPTIRVFQEFSMCFSVGTMFVFILSFLKAFPIAAIKLYNIDFIKKEIFADSMEMLALPIGICVAISVLFNEFIYRRNIKYMVLFCIINCIASLGFMIAFEIYCSNKNYDMEFAGNLIAFLPFMASAFEAVEVFMQICLEKKEQNEAIRE